MLTIPIVLKEDFDEEANEFLQEVFVLQLEHSLLSLSAWEAKYEKPFLTEEAKSPDELLDYFEMMIVSLDAPDGILSYLKSDQVNEIAKYVESKQTATWFRETKGQRSTEIITSELIYYWLVALQIPFEPVESWHLNRLLTLVKICGVKGEKPKKMSRGEMLAQRNALNAQRRAESGSRG